MEIRGIVTITALVLAIIAVSTTTAAGMAVIVDTSCDCGDICVNETGWWRDGGAFNANATTPIQAAVDDATAGETICVKAGNYNENVDITTPHLTLRGEGADVVTVTANSSNDHVFEVTADYVNISGFTATGATVTSKAGFYLNGADHCNISENNVSNNYRSVWLQSSSNNTILSNNASNSGYGIRLYSSSNHNRLTGNIASNNRYGIYLSSSSDSNTILGNTANSNSDEGIRIISSSSNTLLNNTASSNGDEGIYLDSSSGNMLTGNTASSNGDEGIYLDSSSNNTLLNNIANSNDRHGIYLDDSNGNTLASNTANWNRWDGICIDSSGDNVLANNTASSNDYRGIYLRYSSENMLTGNNMSGNRYNLEVSGYNLSEYTQNIDASNTVDGKPVHYWVDQKDGQIPSDAGFVGAVNCTNITAMDMTLTNSWDGVLFVYTENSRIENVTASNNYCGIHMEYSSGNTLRGNIASNNEIGIDLQYSSGNVLENNTALNSIGNIGLHSSNNNTLLGNMVGPSCEFSISLSSSSGNLIYNNYFDVMALPWDDGVNQWNITKTAGTNIIGGLFLGGNYWSDYAGVDNDADGLGDTLLPYNSAGGIQNGGDYLPLVEANSAPPTAVISIGSAEGSGGDTVNLSINITNASAIAAMDIHVTYEDILNVTGVTNGTLIKNLSTPLAAYYIDPDELVINISFVTGTDMINGDGELFVVTFDVVGGVAGESSVLGIVADAYTADLQHVPINLMNGLFVVTGSNITTFTPPNPVNLTHTTGDYWVNYTWAAGTGDNATDSYNVSMNGTWNNGTDTFANASVGPSGWANITVFAYNASGAGTLSAGSASDEVQAPAALHQPRQQ